MALGEGGTPPIISMWLPLRLRASTGAPELLPPLLLALCTGLCVPESSVRMTCLLAPQWAQPVSPVLGVDGMCSLVLSGVV